MEYNFPVTRTTHPKPRPADDTKLGFAKFFTDHMFCMDWDEGQGWHDGRVVPHEPIQIEPASCVLHYAQMMFEGMKAYRTSDGEIQIFRPDSAGTDTQLDPAKANIFIVSASAPTVGEAMAKCENKLGEFLFIGHNQLIVLGSEVSLEQSKRLFSYFIKSKYWY